MSLSQPDIFDAAERRLAWTSERQVVLARDIANLSTPGFQAEDVTPFEKFLSGSVGVQIARTAPNHLEGTAGTGLSAHAIHKAGTRTSSKNGVRLEDQLMKVADTETLHATVTSIYKKYVAMFGTALGRSS